MVMKSGSSNSSRNSSHPPLAHDAQGHPIAMPDGADSWMLKRCTTGRPKVINGTDGRPVRLPLGTTSEQIEDTFGPGTYRLDALDALGNLLDHVTTVEIGGDDDDRTADDRGPTFGTSRGAASDLRFALETIMQMARAQSDSLRAVSEAQADWVKGLANAKALPRNVAIAPPTTTALTSIPDDDDEDEDDDAPDQPTSLPAYAIVAQAAQGIVHDLPNVVQAFASIANLRNAAAQASAASAQTSEATPGVEPSPSSATDAMQAPGPFRASNAMVHLTEITERLDKTERRYLRHVLRHPNADAVTEELLVRPVEDAVAFVRQQIAGVRSAQGAPANDETPCAQTPGMPTHDAPDLMNQVYAVAALLSPDECAAVLALLPRMSPSRLGQLQQQLGAMAPQDAAEWVRENLPSLSAEVAA